MILETEDACEPSFAARNFPVKLAKSAIVLKSICNCCLSYGSASSCGNDDEGMLMFDFRSGSLRFHIQIIVKNEDKFYLKEL